MSDTSLRSNLTNIVLELPINERPLYILNQMNTVNQYIKVLNDAIDLVANVPVTTLNVNTSYTCVSITNYLLDNNIGITYWRLEYFDTIWQLFITEELPKYLRDPKVICLQQCPLFLTDPRVSKNTNLSLGELRLKWLAFLKAKVNESYELWLKQDVQYIKSLWYTLE